MFRKRWIAPSSSASVCSRSSRWRRSPVRRRTSCAAIVRQPIVRGIVCGVAAVAAFARGGRTAAEPVAGGRARRAKSSSPTFRRALPKHAILLTAGDAVDLPPLYFQAIEGWRPDVTIVTYGFLNSDSYRRWLDPTLLRTARGRPRHCAAGSPRSARSRECGPSVLRHRRAAGARARAVLPRARRRRRVAHDPERAEDRRNSKHYAQESALQLAPGYADVTSDPLRSNGFVWEVREYYAGGFFSTGLRRGTLRR